MSQLLKSYSVFGCLIISMINSIFSSLPAQTPNDSISLEQAIDLAKKNYPSIKAKNWNIERSKSNVSLARLAYLPQLNVNLQANYSSLNNIYGLFYPQNVVLPISGPVSTGNRYSGVFGSAAGILMTWEPYTFGKRHADLKEAHSEQKVAEAELAYEVFNHQIKLIDTYLEWLASLELIHVQQSNLERALVLYRSAKVLAGNGLKPGIDTSLAKAEIARARIQLIKARESEAVYKTRLNELLGFSKDSGSFIAKDLSKKPVIDTSADRPMSDQHPSLLLYQSKVNTLQAKSLAIKRNYYPKINLYSTGFARGSGGSVNGNLDRSLHGLAFSKYNYALGATLMLYVFDYPAVRTRYEAASYQRKEQEELSHEEKLRLDNENNIALIKIKAAMKTADMSYAELDAAKESYTRITTMYSSGLSTETDVAQVQYLLNSSEIQYIISRIMIYKAGLYKAGVLGNIDYFLQTLK
jgi:outer membrane protein